MPTFARSEETDPGVIDGYSILKYPHPALRRIASEVGAPLPSVNHRFANAEQSRAVLPLCKFRLDSTAELAQPQVSAAEMQTEELRRLIVTMFKLM